MEIVYRLIFIRGLFLSYRKKKIVRELELGISFEREKEREIYFISLEVVHERSFASSCTRISDVKNLSYTNIVR